MAPWMLSRVSDGYKYSLDVGEHTIGRSQDQKLIISKPCVSRQHCVIAVNPDSLITVEDKKTSNGTFVGTKKIPTMQPFPLTNGDIIGFGCTNGIKAGEAWLSDILFQLVECKEEDEILPIQQRLQFVEDVVDLDSDLEKSEVPEDGFKEYSDIVDLVSDSDLESLPEYCEPQIKTEVNVKQETAHASIKSEQFEDSLPFSLKEEYNVEDEIECLSDSEDDIWAARLSQSSPGRPLKRSQAFDEKLSDPIESFDFTIRDKLFVPTSNFEGSDNVDAAYAVHMEEDEEVFSDDLIRIPDLEELDGGKKDDQAVLEHVKNKIELNQQSEASTSRAENVVENRKIVLIEPVPQKQDGRVKDQKDNLKRRIYFGERKSLTTSPKGSRKESNNKRIKVDRSPLKGNLREDRNRRLKEIAAKEKAENALKDTLAKTSNHSTGKTKVTSCSRGNFLMENSEYGKPTTSSKKQSRQTSSESDNSNKLEKSSNNRHNKISGHSEKSHSHKSKKEDTSISNKSKTDKHFKTGKQNYISQESTDSEKAKGKVDLKRNEVKDGKSRENIYQEPAPTKTDENNSKSLNEVKRFPLKDVPPTNIPSKKPVSAVRPINWQKLKKVVRFSTNLCSIHEFEIEPGNKMKKTSEIKATQMHALPPKSFEQRFLAHMLRWSTKWLEEQINISKPPPILPHNNEPMSICHQFKSIGQYAAIIGDLLLMEVWESVTQSYMKRRDQPYKLQMRLEAPPIIHATKAASGSTPTTLSVNLSLPKTDAAPRAGELMLVMCESEDQPGNTCLYRHPFYIHNVRVLPAPRNNVNQFLSVSLQTLNTHTLQHLQRGALMLGKPLAFIKNELVLMEAIEELRWSSLTPLLLEPAPQYFQPINCSGLPQCRWTEGLNSSQLQAVESAVAAALGSLPSVQMIQGPPGTGKSSVICSTVMRYFYESGKLQSGRGKVLLCATSNAAVDELVVRLLKIRQTLPSEERFRLVRVGREESMHPRALDVSSGRLAEAHARAQRGAQSGPRPRQHDSFVEEINWLQGKLNTVCNQLEIERAKNSAAVPALLQRRTDYLKRIKQFRQACNMGGEHEPTREEKAEAERRVIEHSHIVVTTLTSVANNKLKCLRGRIALCIVDEAGQAIEPETLVPLKLQITKLILIGDPRQLPGFLNSQRAKKLGLGESLFSRLAATTEDWPHNPVKLLDVQYRMHPAIADYPNRAFYQGRVQDRAPARSDLHLPPYSMLFIPSSQGQGDSCSNEVEAWGVSRLVTELWTMIRGRELSLAVITPYNAQKDLIKSCLATLMNTESGCVEVNTVDSFQGQERDVVVVSLARSQGVGFLTDAGRINVMLTRAKHSLLICLNPHALIRNDHWRSLIEDARRRSTFVNLPGHVCRPATAESARTEPVMRYLRI